MLVPGSSEKSAILLKTGTRTWNGSNPGPNFCVFVVLFEGKRVGRRTGQVLFGEFSEARVASASTLERVFL